MSSTPPALRPLTPDEEALVRSLGQVMYVLPRTIDADMIGERQLPLTEYTALRNLSEAPGRQRCDGCDAMTAYSALLPGKAGGGRHDGRVWREPAGTGTVRSRPA